MPNSNNQDQPINFSASHDQASILAEISLKYKELDKIIPNLENLEYLPSNFKKLSPEELHQLSEELNKQYNELHETKKEIINIVTHAKQIVSDLQECAKKFSTIHLPTPDEKLENAQSLLKTHKSLTENEKNRFKEIEEALSNTCIIKSAGDETIKFQLGILGDAKDSNKITESEFNYLVVPRLKDNNLLDSYRLRVEGDMILKRTPLEMCQAINKDRSSDTDYEDSKKLFTARLKGIDCELSLKRFKNLENNDIDRDLTKLRQDLKSVSSQNEDSSEKDILKKELSLPEVPTHPFELNSQQPSNEPTININHTEEDQKKSEFVALMEELIPEKKKNVIFIDTVQPSSLETIMRASLEKSIALSEPEIRTLNFSMIIKAGEITSNGINKLHESHKNSSCADGSSIFEEMQRKFDNLKKDRDEKLKKPVPCKLTGEPLVKGYYEFGNKYLNKKIENYKTAIATLEYNKKNKFGEFSKYNAKYDNLSDLERKTTLNSIYELKKTTFNRELENAKKQLALWLGKKTFTQSIEKKGKIKQEEIAFSEKELHFRNLVLDFNSNSASKGKTIYVYQDGVYLVTNKKAESSNIPQISSCRAQHKNFIPGVTASSLNFFDMPNKKEETPELAMDKSLLRS